MMYAHCISVSYSMARASASAWSSGSAQFCALNATASELSSPVSQSCRARSTCKVSQFVDEGNERLINAYRGHDDEKGSSRMVA
jgi:hypothetical protein